MLRIAICDDDDTICAGIEQILINYSKNLIDKIDVEVFNSGEELLSFIEKTYSFDLIFLDIELITTTGIKVGTCIRETFDDYISKIVFISSKNGYESQLFDIQPLNFIRKPIKDEIVHKCVRLAIKLIGRENQTFEYKKDYDLIKVYIKNIFYFEKIGRKIKIVTSYGEDFFYETIKSIHDKVPSIFIMPQSGFLVNFNKISRLQKDNIILIDGTEIKISRRNLTSIRTILLNLEKEY